MSKEFESLIDKMFFNTFSDHCNLYCYGYGILLEMIHFTGDIYENRVPQHLLPF